MSYLDVVGSTLCSTGPTFVSPLHFLSIVNIIHA
jgi:hypothetical protein